MAVAPCGTLYDPHRPRVDHYGTYSTLTSVSTAYRPAAPPAPPRKPRGTPRESRCRQPMRYDDTGHRAPVTGPSASVTNRHPPVTARPNPGVSPRPSFRFSHPIWHSVTTGGMLGRGRRSRTWRKRAHRPVTPATPEPPTP